MACLWRRRADHGPDLSLGTPIASLSDGEMMSGHVGDDEVILARSGNEYFAVGARCTHYNGRLARIWHERTFETLVERNAVQLGLEVRCNNCSSWSWFALNHLNYELQCSLCLRTTSFPTLEGDVPNHLPRRGVWRDSTRSGAAAIGTTRPPGQGQQQELLREHVSS